MSIKIYNGYKLANRPLYIHQINELLDPARGAMKDKAMDIQGRSIVELAHRIMDKHVALALGFDVNLHDDEKDRISSPLSQAATTIQDSVLEDRIKSRKNFMDPESSVCVFTSEEGTYALLYCENSKLTDVFKEVLGAQEYNYWDNSDEPDDVPKVAWDERRHIWGKLMGDWSAPVEQSASMNLISPNLIFDFHPILVHPGQGNPEAAIPQHWLPEFSSRMRRLAMSTPAASLPPDLAEEQRKTNSLSITMGYIRKIEKGEVPAFNEMVEQLSKIMPQEYTLGDLRLSPDKIAERFGSPKRPSPKP